MDSREPDPRPTGEASLDWLLTPQPRRRRRTVRIVLMLLLTLGMVVAAWWWWPTSPVAGPAGSSAAARRTVELLRKPFAPEALRPLDPRQAQQWNAAIPVADPDTPAAIGFAGTAAAAVDLSRSLDCLTAAIYYEAGNESTAGQQAVAQVVLNRVRHPAYPNSVCGVVYQGASRRSGCQFSFVCDGSLARPRSPMGWARARLVAETALGGYVYAPVGWATHYHADYVVPYWAAGLVKVTTIGAHIFYRWPGVQGTRAAFTDRYAGREPALGALPDAVPSAAPTAANDGPPVAVTEAERPVIFSNAAAPEAPTPTATPSAAAERWVIGRP